MPRDAPAEPQPGLVSVVVTVRNEAANLGALLDSLLPQEGPFEVLVVDSNSTDRTLAIAQGYAQRDPRVRVLEHGGTRGESRNFGVQQARGEFVAFIDGDCVASPQWLHELRQGLARGGIAAGATQQVGYAPFETLERVELSHKGYDVTAPSCNLAYRRDLFEALGGFDPWFRTAEDIDLNFRAVDQGQHLEQVPAALVFHKTRSTVLQFLKQALWNGYGRKQLTLKHGKLWKAYSLRRMFETQVSFWGLVRLAAAVLGYAMAKVRERPRPPKEPRASPQAEAARAPRREASGRP